jgi:hypothetical protein
MQRHLPTQKPVELKTFNERITHLCSPEHGGILRPEGAGMYEFTENRHRGYVRLIAERAGVQLEPEHPLAERMYREFEAYLQRAVNLPTRAPKKPSNKF